MGRLRLWLNWSLSSGSPLSETMLGRKYALILSSPDKSPPPHYSMYMRDLEKSTERVAASTNEGDVSVAEKIVVSCSEE